MQALQSGAGGATAVASNASFSCLLTNFTAQSYGPAALPNMAALAVLGPNAGLWAPCTAKSLYNGLKDGDYLFQAQLTGSAMSQSPDPSTIAGTAFSVDTVPPQLMVCPRAKHF